MTRLAVRAAVAQAGAGPGDHVVVVAGTPYRVSGKTNLVKVETVPPDRSNDVVAVGAQGG